MTRQNRRLLQIVFVTAVLWFLLGVCQNVSRWPWEEELTPFPPKRPFKRNALVFWQTLF